MYNVYAQKHKRKPITMYNTLNAQQGTSHSSGYSWLTCPSDKQLEYSDYDLLDDDSLPFGV
jgi:hypothetical protein